MTVDLVSEGAVLPLDRGSIAVDHTVVNRFRCDGLLELTDLYRSRDLVATELAWIPEPGTPSSHPIRRNENR